METSLQAPQIIGWVQTLLPKLPRDPAGKSRMEGLEIENTDQTNASSQSVAPQTRIGGAA